MQFLLGKGLILAQKAKVSILRHIRSHEGVELREWDG
jgi:hypothetical protein